MSRSSFALVVALALVAGGCGGDTGIKLAVTPAHASLFGQTDVTITGDLQSLGDVDYFAIGGVQVINPRWSGSSVTVTVQGAPMPGRYDIVIRGKRGLTIQHELFTYDPPPAGVKPTWMAFGASFTQGTESLGIDPHTQLYGVTGQIARAAQIFIGLPLFNPQLAPPLQPSDFYADCTQIPGTGAGVTTLTSVTTSPDTGFFDLRYGRLDWTLHNRNVAVGGATVFDILNGVHGAKALLAHIVNDPDIDYSDAVAPETTSMIDRVEALDPDIGVCTDLLGNDFDAAVTQPSDLDPTMITPIAQVAPMLQTMMQRLGKLHGQYFIANIPPLTFVPHVVALRRALVDAGKDTTDFDAKAAQIDAATEAYNQALLAAMAPYPNLHVVDFKQYVADVKGGITVGGERLTVDRWGGLLSLDDLHLTDTGYALYAQKFLDAINAVEGTQIPPIDVEAVHAQDALSPSKTRAAGYTCVPAAM
jgi:lysophospholipase L1-like esterase